MLAWLLPGCNTVLMPSDDATMARIEEKLDVILGVLNEFRPLLDRARRTLDNPATRFMTGVAAKLGKD